MADMNLYRYHSDPGKLIGYYDRGWFWAEEITTDLSRKYIESGETLVVVGNWTVQHNFKFPDNVHVKGSLHIREEGRLPNNLKVDGILNLRGNHNATKLPKNLQVHSIDISSTNISDVSMISFTKGDMILSYSKVSRLPENLTVGKNLIIGTGSYGVKEQDKSLITSLPRGLKVYGLLDISNTNIEELPENLNIGDIELKGSAIKSIPKRIGHKIVRVDISGCKNITSLPPWMENITNLFLAGTGIEYLPEDLREVNILSLSGSKIKKLPENLKVRDLDLSDTPIAELPNGLDVGHRLNLHKTNITELPKDLKVRGELDITDMLVKSIPPSITSLEILQADNSGLESLDNITIGELTVDNAQNFKVIGDNVKVLGSVSLRNTNLRSIGKKFSVGEDWRRSSTTKDCDLSETQITDLPEDMNVGGYLMLYYTPLVTKEKYSSNLQQVEKLNIAKDILY